jgi:CRISPR-associated exonuclease Cas4
MIDDVARATATITVTDLRQYNYCPRVVYFTGMVPRPLTGKMREGLVAHEEEIDREHRRSLRPYKLDDGERFYKVRLCDTTLGLSAVLDMLVVRDTEVIPIEHKMSNGPIAGTHRAQLMAYGLLASSSYGLSAKRGFVYWLPRRRATEVPFTADLETKTRRLTATVREIRAREALPEPTPQLEKCTDCEFRRFCGDRPRR